MSTLKSHLQTHTGEKSHVCEVFDRGFPKKNAIKKDFLTQTGEKTSCFRIIQQNIFQKGDLKRHIQRYICEKSYT